MAISSSQIARRLQAPTRVPAAAPAQGASGKAALKIAYAGTLLFAIVYFARPNDWLHFLGIFPVAKAAALLPIVALFAAVASGYRIRFTREFWVLLLLFVQLVICIPFSTWRGGSLDTVLFDFGKIVLITLVLIQVLNNASRLRRLIFVHTAAVTVVSLISIREGTQEAGRMTGALGSLFGNPNDLAIAIAMIVPFALMFFLLTRNPVKRVLWGIVLLTMMYAIVETFSRTGFLSLIAVILAAGWYFGIQCKDRKVLVAIVVLVLMSPIALTGKYLVRVESIVNSSLDETGSADARHQLLIRSLDLAAAHPLFGIGPGQFAVYSGDWHVAHNSYTEMAAEAGFPAGILFIWLFGCTYNRLRKAVSSPHEPSRELLYLRAATLTCLASFGVSAFFASLEYNFFPYFLVAYCSSVATLMKEEDQPIPVSPAIRTFKNRVPVCAE